MKFLNFLCCLIVIIFANTAFAFVESYSFFGSKESNTVNGPENINGEYYSDILAFRNSIKNDFKFLEANNAYDIYVGSLNSRQFAIQQRLKLNQQISENLFFDLVYIEKENLEEGREQFISGLTYNLNRTVSFSAYTSLFSNKDENDIGLAINLNLNSSHKLRLFMNFIDFSFNERNQVEAEDQKSPLNFGLYGRWLSDHFQFFEYYLYQNSSVVRDFTQIDERYIFEETRIGLRGKRKLSQNYDFNFDLDAFQGEEGRFLLTTPDPTTDLNWSRSGVRFLNQIESGSVIAGFEYNYRYWSSDAGSVQHSNIMPHVWYNIRLNDQKVFLPNSIDLGLEASFHEAQGPADLRSLSDQDSEINSRFNLRLYYEFSKTAILNLLLSADLDDNFSWEGGGGQFQILF